MDSTATRSFSSRQTVKLREKLYMLLRNVASVLFLSFLLFSGASVADSAALKAKKTKNEQILKQKKAEENNSNLQAKQKTLERKGEQTRTAKDPIINPVKSNQLEAEREARCRTQPDAGPEMIIIAAGKFLQGSDDNEPGHRDNESPQHEVTISTPFAISRCEVTLAEFRRFIEDTGYKTEAERSGGCYYFDGKSNTAKQQPDNDWDNPGFEQDENHPVTCVSWNDAKAYIKWLNDDLKLAENNYRLPTESEWEYAARAGTQRAFFWGEQSLCDYANGADTSLQNTKNYPGWDFAECDDGFVYTAPVGSFKPNAWGLYDMSGNDWEWAADCWHDSYQDSPLDGSAWLDEGKEDCMRSVRGGGWDSLPAYLRSANRDWYRVDEADYYLGFRLARTL